MFSELSLTTECMSNCLAKERRQRKEGKGDRYESSLGHHKMTQFWKLQLSLSQESCHFGG